MTRSYRPSNGDEGLWFEARWCDRCQRDREFLESDGQKSGCGIHARALAFGTEEPEYPSEWVLSDDGEPCCTAFQEYTEPEPVDPRDYHCPFTLDLFEAMR